ncbi:MAG: 16S rRNA (cytosine(1402)-N(4))-methyltransferase RsmH [Flavobacteriales bacterium]|nr:16S rRNA (cytosine(1402)-N(4))-methyltransferase RsmH [Flavobacteriales bacterium]MDW8432323.1 16S rRNA (cytosine(1402)-N(4))-methyltransferase RsmH [Flavobacteriales bacterium]
MMAFAPPVYHVPVMAREVGTWLVTDPDGVYVDCTFGGGGHSRVILGRLSEKGRLVAMDKDFDSPAKALEDDRLLFVHGDFRYLANYLDYLEIGQPAGILADLGISSHQVDTPQRGFSFRREGPLDMRMNADQELSARSFLNQTDEEELATVLKQYGEVPSSRFIARRILQFRKTHGLNTSEDLVRALEGMRLRGSREKLLSCVFQAIRLHVNGELDALRSLLLASQEILAPGGRMVVISYHSLEDRLVKNFFRFGNFEGRQEKDAFGTPLRPLEPLLTKALQPTAEEVKANPRARSARLRVAMKPQIQTQPHART